MITPMTFQFSNIQLVHVMSLFSHFVHYILYLLIANSKCFQTDMTYIYIQQIYSLILTAHVCKVFIRSKKKFKVSLMVFNNTFNNISVISWNQFYWWKKLEYLEKTIAMLQVMVIGTDCTGSCKSNYHTITTTTAPIFLQLYNISYLLVN